MCDPDEHFIHVYTNLHAAGRVAQTGICSHLDGSVFNVLCQIKHSRVEGDGLIKVTLSVVRTAQVAVRSCFLAAILQFLSRHLWPCYGLQRTILYNILYNILYSDT